MNEKNHILARHSLLDFCQHTGAWLFGLAWLMPNHYPPWLAAWNEGVAIFALLLLSLPLMLACAQGVRVSWHIPLLILLACLMATFQWLIGKIHFSGDLVLVLLYLGLALLAFVSGRKMGECGEALTESLMSAWVLAALVSVGIALLQWSDVTRHLFLVEMPPGGRPFANLSQPNHFCTLCLLGTGALFWLHQQDRLRLAVFVAAACTLLLGMVISQSRTGWLQVTLLLFLGLAFRQRCALRTARWLLLSLGGAFVAFVLLWPWLSEIMLLATGRTLEDQMAPGVRLPYWQSMLDAITREPWLGYGWQQVSMAQLRVALDHPPIHALFDYSHNLLLDLLLWNGIPCGLLIFCLAGAWLAGKIRRCRNGGALWLLAAVGGMLTHAMLEYPLSYAHFLLPCALALGMIDGTDTAGQKEIHLSRRALLAGVVVLGSVFFATLGEYLDIEERVRSMRFELANIGTPSAADKPAREILLLTQLDAYIRFSRDRAKPGLSQEKMAWMRQVYERYGYPAIMLRYAMAAGLNGEPQQTRETLENICHIHTQKSCKEAKASWLALQKEYPQLLEIPFPPEPKKKE